MFHTSICDLLGIRYPILQGAMQGGGGVELVAAVSAAGGLGVQCPDSEVPIHFARELPASVGRSVRWRPECRRRT